MDYDFDVIVIGSGAGGASFAHACSRANKSVLIVERGKEHISELRGLDEHLNLIDRLPYDDREIIVNGEQMRLYIGGMVGGSTSVYGGVMLRPSSEDFHPGKHYSTRLTRELWDWPIEYSQLELYYDRAEKLFKLAADQQDDFQPLHKPHRRIGGEMLPLAPINAKLMKVNKARGLLPFRLPLAIDANLCQKCDSCAGFLCPYDARRSAAQIIREDAVNHQVHMLTETEAEHLETDACGRVQTLSVRCRKTNETRRLRARCYALAAGAIGSAAILLRSRIGGSLVGKNLMMHYSPLTIGLFPKSTEANETFIKQVGFADFYFGTEDMRAKMGIIQSLPAPGPLMMAKNGLKKLPKRLLTSVRRRMLPLVGTIEDLPSPENSVYLRENQSIGLRYKTSPFDQQRGKALTHQMRKILHSAGALLCPTKVLPPKEHMAHQCGTLRFGTHRDHAVADADCRVFGHENLFVADGSVLPTSMGVGPSLTIAANAMRVADIALASI